MKEDYLPKLHNSQLKILDEIVRICEMHKIVYFLIGGTLLGAVRHSGYIPWDDDLDIAMPREDYNKFIEYAQKELKEDFILDCFKTNKKYWLPFIKIRLKNTIMAESTLKDYNGCKGIFVDIFPLDSAKDENSIDIKKRKKTEEKIKAILMKKNICKIRLEQGFIFNLKVIISKCIPNKLLHSILNRAMQNEGKEEKYFVNLGSQYKIEKQTHLKEKYYPAKKIKFEDREYFAPNDYEYVLTKIYGSKYMELPPVEKRVTHKPLMVQFEDGECMEFSENG